MTTFDYGTSTTGPTDTKEQAQQAAEDDHAPAPEPGHDPVAREPADRHRHREGRVAERRPGRIEPPLLDQEDRAPVEGRALGEEHREAEQAQDQHRAAGQRAAYPQQLGVQRPERRIARPGQFGTLERRGILRVGDLLAREVGERRELAPARRQPPR